MSAPLRHQPSQESSQSLERRIRALLLEGRIPEACDLLQAAGPSVAVDPKLREVLAPPKVTISAIRDTDRSAEFEWLRTRSGPYRGQWVALVGPELVASAPSLKELRAQLAALPSVGKPLIHRIE
jgi:hypothetical protein